MWVNKQEWRQLKEQVYALHKEVCKLKVENSLGKEDLGLEVSPPTISQIDSFPGLDSWREHCCSVRDAIRMILDLLRKELNCEIKFERPSQEPALVAVKKETPEGEEQ